MSHEKYKTETYQQFGGINSASSPYVLGPMEFLDLSNLDFQVIGAITERWGSTQYMSQIVTGPVTSISEFTRNDGSSYLITGAPGTIYSGATTGAEQGLSFTLQGVTTTSIYAFPSVTAAQAGGTVLITEATTWGIKYLGGDKTITRATFIVAPVDLSGDNNLSSVVMNNYMFAADGKKFFKFDGVTTTPVGLPPVTRPCSSVSLAGFPAQNLTFGASTYASTLAGSSYFIGMGATGQYLFYMSYINNRGFEGPIWPVQSAPGGSWPAGASMGAIGGTFLVDIVPISTPLQFGISAIRTYLFWTPTLLSEVGALFYPLNKDLWNNYPYVKLVDTPASGSTITWVELGSTTGGQSLMWTNSLGILPDPIVQGYVPLGITYGVTTVIGGPGSDKYISSFLYNQTFPSFLEVYSNRLFSAGFSSSPSTVWFSDLDEPEGYQADWNFDVFAKNGDSITGMKAYQSKLYIFKNRSVHVLLGDDPANFNLQLVTDQYGAINNRCIVVFEDVMIFLDKKGVMLYNGGSLDNLSNKKIQPLIDRINWDGAPTYACMVHDKARSQVLISVPTGVNTIPDLILVYDYKIGAWTHYDGLNVTAFLNGIGRFKKDTTFFGNYSGMINHFGSSFLTDNGVGITTYLKPRFLHDMGDSTQKQFRRLFVNTNSAGTTVVFNTNFYQDYGTSIVKSMTIVQTGFQSRTEFGISAKSLAFEMSSIQTNIRLTIFGFTIESRMQRRV